MTPAEVVHLLTRVSDFLRNPGKRDTAFSLLADVEAAIKAIEKREP